MTVEHSTQRFGDGEQVAEMSRVEIGFAGAPPVRQIERASGVSDVEIDGLIVRCLVTGSFQPFLEALRGHEVITLQSTPVEGGH